MLKSALACLALLAVGCGGPSNIEMAPGGGTTANRGGGTTSSAGGGGTTANAGGGGTTSNAGGGGSGGGGGMTTGPDACGALPWVADQAYKTGDIVTYSDGNDYIATHDNPGYDPTISTWYWSPYTCTSGGGGGGGAGGGGTTSNGGGGGTTSSGGGGGTSTGSGLASILSEAQFDQMFPNRNAFYTYQGLVNATASYPAFATGGGSDVQKREVAAFLANVAHETGELVYVEEIVKGDYCQSSSDCPCAAGKQYYGRGPLQISWNFNYCAVGKALNLPLQANPDLVAQDATVAWQTGLWYWMTSTGAGQYICHDAIVDGDGFGETIRTINGSIECNGGNPTEVQDRVTHYQTFCTMLGVDPGSNLSC